ncbi:Pycsar system effector family protein [Actinacidiphila glaucinigra]|uniref:Pycsar system effector family protein n=1 Tax=Actinacidiphila glaucinigra TaxID=235986 RepID=UPI00366B9951
MPDTGDAARAAELGRRWVEARATEMFTQVQRADGKATTLCGVAGGLLAVDVAVLSSLPWSQWLSVGALVGVAAFLGMAIIAALCAIRPALPGDGGLGAFVSSVAGAHQHGAESASRSMGLDEGQRAEAERLAALAALAHRKLRAIKWAVDLTISAIAMAGFALLGPCITA